jgi:Phage integrase family
VDESFGHLPDQPIVNMRKAWKKATKAAGCPDLLFHDLRRTGVRNLIRSGTNEKVAISISGHKTRATFDRYRIISRDELDEAMDKLDPPPALPPLKKPPGPPMNIVFEVRCSLFRPACLKSRHFSHRRAQLPQHFSVGIPPEQVADSCNK